MLRKIRSLQGGSALIIVLVLMAAFGTATYYSSGLIKIYKKDAVKNNLRMEIDLVALNILEIGKYLLLYERFFPVGDGVNPLIISEKMNKLSLTSEAFLRGCPVKSFKTFNIDNSTNFFHIDSKQILCSLSLRNPMSQSFEFEDEILEVWSKSSFSYAPLKRVTSSKPGAYTLRKDLAIPKTDDSNQVIKLNLDPISLAFRRIISIKLNFIFYSQSSGFEITEAERFAKIIVKINHYTNKEESHTRELIVEKEIMYIAATMQEFSLFLAYPWSDTADRGQAPTHAAEDFNKNTFSKVVKIGKNSNIHGRTFFHGMIDIAEDNKLSQEKLDLLPNFKDTLLLTDIMTYFRPTESAIDKMKVKFPKGILQNFGPQLVYDGVPYPGSGFYGGNATGGLDYLSPFFNYSNTIPIGCQLSDDATTGAYDIVYNFDTAAKCGASSFGGDFARWNADPIYGGKIRTVTLAKTPAYILAPVEKLIISSTDKNVIYGTIVGGKIESTDLSKVIDFYSITNMQSGAGYPGIPDSDVLNTLNQQSFLFSGGVSVPLRNVTAVIEK